MLRKIQRDDVRVLPVKIRYRIQGRYRNTPFQLLGIASNRKVSVRENVYDMRSPIPLLTACVRSAETRQGQRTIHCAPKRRQGDPPRNREDVHGRPPLETNTSLEH